MADGCALKMRRLIEIAIIEAFEKMGIAAGRQSRISKPLEMRKRQLHFETSVTPRGLVKTEASRNACFHLHALSGFGHSGGRNRVQTDERCSLLCIAQRLRDNADRIY
ncbi:hypothetical protein P0R31_32830 [Bradyrhizobium yuanmingense]|uniref:hypothetical protein n=1 Tax=Bradyrhizobium yuanmingense TaxID=108015 RepID=UPI0023B970F0|nr:hypothetical protein [Bradyrhizobium yuanmingense]MDF0522031.1 hypothetical protein [Bradyrhizobium yuanmingense]